MVTYQNRLNSCVPCQSKNTTSSTSTKTTEKTLDNVNCGAKDIVSFSIVDGKIVVMYDDCSYQVEPLSKLDSTFYEKLEKGTLENFQKEINSLKEKIAQFDALIASMIIVNDFTETPSFRAFPIER